MAEKSGISRTQILTMLNFFIQGLPDFVDEHWPKGDQDRGVAMTALALYLAEQRRYWKDGKL